MDGGAATPMERFEPGTDPRAFRSALGAFATGVTVITTATEEGPCGITANSFASVSLDPPLVLWSPAKASRRFELFAHAPHFAIHVLGRDQKWIGDGFTRAKDAFDRLDWHEGPNGVPIIDGAVACFECDLEARHDAGDHAIVVGRVTRVHARPGPALVFQGGAFGGFAGD